MFLKNIFEINFLCYAEDTQLENFPQRHSLQTKIPRLLISCIGESLLSVDYTISLAAKLSSKCISWPKPFLNSNHLN